MTNTNRTITKWEALARLQPGRAGGESDLDDEHVFLYDTQKDAHVAAGIDRF